MRNLRDILCALCAFLAAADVARAVPFQGGDPVVTAQLQAGVVKLGSQAVAKVTVEGTTRAMLLDLETVDGLKFIGTTGPQRAVYESILRGQRTRSESLTWNLHWRPERIGTFEIPPVRIEIDGREFTTGSMNLKVVEDFKGQNLGYFEWIDPPTKIYEGEPFEVTLRFGWDWAMTNFHHINLILPWWGRLSGTLEVTSSQRGGQRPLDVMLNYNGQVRIRDLGRRELDGRDLRVFELRRTLVSTRTGTLSFPASYFEFGRVERGFSETRRQIYYIAWPAFEVEVLPLPEEGRPYEFSGGVGLFGTRSSVDRRSIDLGESLKLTVEWTGTGNLEFFEPPDLGREDAFSGFRFYGATDRFHGDRRVVIYDLAPKNSQVSEVPPVRLSIFDPDAKKYVNVETAPIPIRVRVPEGFEGFAAEGEGEAFGLDLRDIATTPREEAGSEGPGDPLLMGLPLAVFLGWIVLRREVRRRGDPASHRARRRRRARKNLSRGLMIAADARAQAEALRAFLGDRTDEAATAWEGRDVTYYATDTVDVDPAAVQELASLMEDLDASIWCGDGRAVERARLLAAVDAAMGGGL